MTQDTSVSNAETTALFLLGEDAPEQTPRHRASTLMRNALTLSDFQPFSVVHHNFAAVVTAAGALQICSLFQGKSYIAPSAEAARLDGFYETFKGLSRFHGDSVDFEDEYLAVEEKGFKNMEWALREGTNKTQAMAFLPMGVTYTGILSGSVMDFWFAYKTIMRPANDACPSLKCCMADIWTDFTVKYPILTEALREVQP